MWLRGRSKTALCLSVISFLFTPAIAKHRDFPASLPAAQRVVAEGVGLTCDRQVIDPQSYEMATIGQARTLLSDRSDFWKSASKAPAHPSQTSTSCFAGSKVSSWADSTNFCR